MSIANVLRRVSIRRGYAHVVVSALSPRTRVAAIVALCALAAGATAAAVAWVGRDTAGAPAAVSGPREGSPPLALDVLVEDRGEAVDLQSAARLYQQGKRGAARRAFAQILADDPGSLDAAVGAALARWPNGTLAALRKLSEEHPGSALVKLHEGFALLWLGRDAAAETAWAQALAADPDSEAAVRAESLLHPEMPQGRPFFVSSRTVPTDLAGALPLEQLIGLETLARDRDDASSWIVYGVALQRAGRSVSAKEAFDHAVELEPDNVEAQTAAAVARFTKDDPTQTFSRLGPLSRDHPGAAVVRFHLGLCLLWLRDVADARAQLDAAVRSDPQSIWGREAAQLEQRLDEARAAGTSSP
jgi:predicted Zn-dependent protease